MARIIGLIVAKTQQENYDNCATINYVQQRYGDAQMANNWIEVCIKNGETVAELSNFDTWEEMLTEMD